jgi:hypothetical protein
MPVSKTIAVVGASEETTAHLRLLMKLGARQLQHHWRWGTEDTADFVAVEVRDLGAQGVIARCQAGGVPCALLVEADETVVHGLVLRRPFKLEQIVAVLNAAGAATADTGAVEAFAEDFYVRELEDFSTAPAPPDQDIWGTRERAQPMPRLSDAEQRAGLDYHIKGDPLVEPEKPKALIQPGTTFARGDAEPSKRAEARAEQNRHRVPTGVVGDPVDVAPIVIPRNEGLSVGTPDAGPRLLDWLDGDLLRSPAQMQLPECPALTLDPKQRVFHADADLADLIAYCVEPIPQTMAVSTSTSDLARVREAQPGRPYDDLRWLDALLRSSGRLASRLDPGGTYQVRQPVTVNPDFQTHGAIVKALAQPMRLHEVANQTGAGMDRVFDVVNAYDAIGRLTWTPRQRRTDADPAQDRGGTGVLSRIKWPFGKR